MEWNINPEAGKSMYWYTIVGTTILLLFLIYFFFNTLLRSLTYWKLIYVIFWIGFVVFLGALFTWKYYLAEFNTPKKLRWDGEGIEMINMFDKRVKIPWKYILTVKYYREKIFGKWEEAYYVRYRIPDLFIFKQNRFWVSKEIGDKLYAYWARIRSKEEWNLKEEDMDKLKIEGGDV